MIRWVTSQLRVCQWISLEFPLGLEKVGNCSWLLCYLMRYLSQVDELCLHKLKELKETLLWCLYKPLCYQLCLQKSVACVNFDHC